MTGGAETPAGSADDSQGDENHPGSESPTPLEAVADPSRYQGADRYVNVAEDFLGVEMSAVQRRILRAVGEHRRVHIQSGNGVGKSFAAAVLNLSFLVRHPNSIALATSGTYSVLADVLWTPLRGLWKDASLPGRALESPPRIEFDEGWYFKAISPRHPGSLEGRHADHILVTLEEVDKPDITQAHIDSAESLLTSPEDRIAAISNPPEDESNVAHDLAEDDRWHTIQFSSFESRNVKVDAGETSTDRIPGLVDLATIKDDWRNWMGEEWPGLETARVAHRVRDDLDERWYRRRAGVMPPRAASAHRPIDVGAINKAWERTVHDEDVPDVPSACGIDVARSGDRTVLISVHGPALKVQYSEQGANHIEQEAELRRALDDWMDADEPPVIVIDAVGEGSGLGDRLQQAYPDVHRYNAGSTASQEREFRDRWSEALHALGDVLEDGGSIEDRHLREELLACARSVAFDERHLASRGKNGATVLEATSKSAVEDQLGRSPDHLDAAAMAAWAHAGHANTTRRIVNRGTPQQIIKERRKREKRANSDSDRVVRRRSPGAGVTQRRSRSTVDEDTVNEKKRCWWADDR